VETERDANTSAFTGDQQASDGSLEVDGSPGGISVLEPGQRLAWAPVEHPSGSYAPYTQQVIREIASALGVTYSSLAGDLSQANYSSLRHGKSDENRFYSGVQSFLIARFHTPVFERWLDVALANGSMGGLPMSKRGKFASHTWHAPVPESVDALKDAGAAERELELGITTRTDLAAARGKDFGEIVERLKIENEMLAEAGVALGTSGPAPAQPESSAAAPASDPAEAITADADAKAASALALNGAQVESLLQVLREVASGAIPKAVAITILQTAFAVSAEAAKAMVEPIEVRPAAPTAPPEEKPQ
jgi:capsid protein